MGSVKYWDTVSSTWKYLLLGPQGDTPPAGDDLDAFISTFSATISSSQSYAEPTGPNVTDFITGMYEIMRGATSSSLLTALGFTVTTGVEAVTKKNYALIVNEYGTSRAWGAYLIDMTNPIKHIIECPHTAYDNNTEVMTMELWRKIPGSILLLAGAERTAPSGTNLADVAHQVGSLFHLVAAELSSYGLPQLQIHGYADASDAAHDVIVSSGDSNASTSIKRIAKQIEATGLRVGRSWDASATVLTGTTNSQGDLALANGTVFVHIENNNTLRATPALLTKWYEAIEKAAAVDTIAVSRPLRAEAVSGQFPSSIGSANSAGTGNYVARSDHVHRLTSNTPANGDTVQRVSGTWQSQTPTQAKTNLSLENVDNTSDATKNAASVTLTNKTLDITNTVTVVGNKFTLQDQTDNTKQALFSLGSISTATTRTYTLPNSSATLGTTSSTQTFTNKRVTPRAVTTASSATPAIDTDVTDVYGLTALAVNVTSFTTSLTGTPTDGQKLWIYIVGTAARTLAWGASFEAGAVALPTTTVTTTRLDVGFIWNAATSKWRCMAAG